MDPIRINFFQTWIRGSGSTITERWIQGSGSGSTFSTCGSQDLDPCQNEMDLRRKYSVPSSKKHKAEYLPPFGGRMSNNLVGPCIHKSYKMEIIFKSQIYSNIPSFLVNSLLFYNQNVILVSTLKIKR